MGRASSGGMANWRGAAFELRLGVEFCVYILTGEAAGLAPGAVRSVQLQAPEAVDDLVLEFEHGAKWAIQAKAGSSVRVEWKAKRPFGKALIQLYEDATSDQIDLSPGSLDRLELAVDHRAGATLTAFGEWLVKARKHHDWVRFAAAAASSQEARWAEELPRFLEAGADDRLLAFLQKLHVRRALPPDEWWHQLRGRLIVSGVPDADTAAKILDLLLAQVAGAAPYAGVLDAGDLQRACAGLPGLPRPGAPPFRIFREFTEDDLYAALRMPPVRLDRFVARPELASALASEQGVLVAGRPGSGKSHALIKLALAHPDWPVVVVARHFRGDDLGRLAAALGRLHGPYQLLWDDIQDKPGLFADAVLRLAGREDPLRVLAAYRDQYQGAVRERVTRKFCRRAGIQSDPVRLRPFDAEQSAEMAGAVVEALDLDLDGAAQQAYARHVEQGDGGPLFALSAGLLLREEEQSGRRVRAAGVARLPADLVGTWEHLYKRLAGRPNGLPTQNLLAVLAFLHTISCPLHARLCELLYTEVLGHNRGEFAGAVRALEQEGWLRREEEDLAAHDVTLEAVPEEAESNERFVRFACRELEGEPIALGLLRGSLASSYAGQIPRTRTVEERRSLVSQAAELGQMAVDDFRSAEQSSHLAMSLNNASAFYSELAGLEETRQGRAERLRQAVEAIDESVRIRRGLGLQADLAGSLNNASAFYSELAGLEETWQGRAERLRQAVEAIEEAVSLYRGLGLQAELAMSLNNAANRYSELAGLEETRQGRAERLRQAVEAIEEAVSLCRGLGLQAELATSLNNASAFYGELAGRLEETRQGQAKRLRQAVEAIEEAVSLYRGLGLQAELATSLNNVANRYSELAGLEGACQGRAERLRQAMEAIEESVRIRRGLGLQADLASSLNNAANLHSELAGLEETRQGRAERLRQAVEVIEESVRIRRGLGLQADLSMALNNAANLYSELAGLEETRKGRAERLRQAVEAIEESVSLYRGLGLQANLAMSLGTIARIYRAVAGSTEDEQERVIWLGKALESIEEALVYFRESGVVQYWALAVRECVVCHWMLAQRTGELDAERVLALCREGEALCRPMQDEEGLAFYRQVRRAL